VSWSRVTAIAGRIVRQFRHDRRTVALIIVVPLAVMALIGYLVGDSGKEPLPVAVVNLDEGGTSPVGTVNLGEVFVRSLRDQDSIEVRAFETGPGAEEAVRDGEVAGAIELPSDLSARLAAGEGVELTVAVTGTNPSLTGPVVGAVQTALRETAASIPGGEGAATGAVTIRTVSLEGVPGLTTIDYYAPVLVAVFTFFFTFLLTSVSFLRERASGTLDRLMASPVSRLDVELGYLLGFLGFAMLQTLIVLGYATFVLHVEIAGPLWLVLLVLVLLVIGSVNLGIPLSFYARNELQVVQFIPLVLLPQIFLGGLVWPVETLWTPLRWLSQAFPLTHATAILRDVMLAGAGLADVWPRLVALVAFDLATVALGVVVLRRQRA
jgi:ABC-2 type transport system permease protein